MSSQESKNIVTGSMVVLGLMVVLSNDYVRLLRDFIQSHMSGASIASGVGSTAGNAAVGLGGVFTNGTPEAGGLAP